MTLLRPLELLVPVTVIDWRSIRRTGAETTTLVLAGDVDAAAAKELAQKHFGEQRFVTPEEFKSYETIAYTKGFLMVSSSPLTRSSHHAGDDFARLKAAREAKNRTLAR